MRALTLIPLLVLAACSGENQGWNPNYQAFATPYGDYLRAREMALTGRAEEPPRIIPIALPARAPTASQIAGPSPVQMVEQAFTPNSVQPRRVRLRGAPAIDPVPPTLPSERTVLPQPVIISPAVRAQTPVARRPSATQPVQVETRSLSNSVDRVEARSVRRNGNCAAFPSPQAAQRTFQREGGPARDPLGLDPDGDGFACTYTPPASPRPR